MAIALLLGGSVYLALLIQDESKPTGTTNTRASEVADPNKLLAYKTTEATPSGTITRVMTPQPSTSTAKAATVTSAVSPTSADDIFKPYNPFGSTATPMPLPSQNTIARASAEPTSPLQARSTMAPIDELPVAGFGDALKPFAIGAGALILIAFIL